MCKLCSLFYTNGYWQDGFKALVYLIPLLYLIFAAKKLKLRHFWLIFFGLSLLFMGHFLDYMDEFSFVHDTFTDPMWRLLEDFLEDFVGFALGFVVFITGVFLELKDR